jgi:hypothetical protein
MRERCWTWVEDVFERILLPDIAVSAILACVLLSIFTIFNYKLSYFQFNIPDLEFLYPESFCPCPDICGTYNCTAQYLFVLPGMMTNFAVAISMSLLISFEIFSIKNILKIFKNSLQNQKFNTWDDLAQSNWYNGLKARFTSSHWKYLIILSVVLQVFVVLYIYYSNNGDSIFFYFSEQKTDVCPPWGAIWGGLFDVYIRGLNLVSFYLLASILWILINITWSMVELGHGQYKDELRVNIISPDNFSELHQYKNLVLKGFTFYSICISLAILTDPSLLDNGEITYLNASLIVLFLIGLITSLVSILAIKNIHRYKITMELRRLNEIYRSQYEVLAEAISNGNRGKYNIDLSALTAAMKAILEEKDRIISKNRSGYELRTIGTFFASFLLPIASKIIQEYFSSGLRLN